MKLAKLAAGVVAVATLTATATACGSGGGSSSGGTVTLKFQSLAFQKPTVTAVKKIVADWNKSHPKIQVKETDGSWDSVHDQLVTQFAGGTAPDIIHDESADIAGFGQQGYLADLTPYLSADVQSSVPQGVWKTVTQDKKVIGAPTLLQSYVVMANTDLLKRDGITVPTGKVSWTQLQSMAKQATKGGAFGLGWGLKEPTSTVLSLALNFGGTFFSGSGQSATVKVGANENQVPQRIHQMIYQDKSLSPTTVTQGGTDILPQFFAGKLAMVVEGNYAAQQITEQAPKNFHWAVLPPLTGTSTNQAADPQTLSVSAASKHAKEAGEFISYFMQTDNLAAVGQGDWLIPTTSPARQAIATATKGANGWTQTLAGASTMTAAPFQAATNYPQWKDQIATPLLQKYFANQISLSDLDSKLAAGWTQVNR